MSVFCVALVRSSVGAPSRDASGLEEVVRYRDWLAARLTRLRAQLGPGQPLDSLDDFVPGMEETIARAFEGGAAACEARRPSTRLRHCANLAPAGTGTQTVYAFLTHGKEKQWPRHARRAAT